MLDSIRKKGTKCENCNTVLITGEDYVIECKTTHGVGGHFCCNKCTLFISSGKGYCEKHFQEVEKEETTFLSIMLEERAKHNPGLVSKEDLLTVRKLNWSTFDDIMDKADRDISKPVPYCVCGEKLTAHDLDEGGILNFKPFKRFVWPSFTYIEEVRKSEGIDFTLCCSKCTITLKNGIIVPLPVIDAYNTEIMKDPKVSKRFPFQFWIDIGTKCSTGAIDAMLDELTVDDLVLYYTTVWLHDNPLKNNSTPNALELPITTTEPIVEKRKAPPATKETTTKKAKLTSTITTRGRRGAATKAVAPMEEKIIPDQDNSIPIPTDS